MFLLKKKVRGVNIHHPLADQTPKRVTHDRLLELVQKLRAGDDAVKDEIVLGHVHLAIQIAGRYAACMPKKRVRTREGTHPVVDDVSKEAVVSESIYGVVYAVERIREHTEGDDVGAWIASCCHRFAARYVLRDLHRKCRSNKKLSQDNIVLLHGLEKATSKPTRYGQETFLSTKLLDLRELVEISAVTPIEKKIMELRVQGYQDPEIGEQLGYDRKYIHKLRSVIRKRFERLASV